MPRLVDTTIRLMSQEPLAGRMPTADILRLAEILDRAGFAYLEVSGGGAFGLTMISSLTLLVIPGMWRITDGGAPSHPAVHPDETTGAEVEPVADYAREM